MTEKTGFFFFCYNRRRRNSEMKTKIFGIIQVDRLIMFLIALFLIYMIYDTIRSMTRRHISNSKVRQIIYLVLECLMLGLVIYLLLSYAL